VQWRLGIHGQRYFDWYFYDRYGNVYVIAAAGRWHDDPVSLVNLSNTTTCRPLRTNGTLPSAMLETDLARSYLWTSHPTLRRLHPYQARIKSGSKTGRPGYFFRNRGWFNTTVGRKLAGIHSRIVVGPASGGANAVAFFLDDMNAAQMTGTATGMSTTPIELKRRIQQRHGELVLQRPDV